MGKVSRHGLVHQGPKVLHVFAAGACLTILSNHSKGNAITRADREKIIFSATVNTKGASFLHHPIGSQRFVDSVQDSICHFVGSCQKKLLNRLSCDLPAATTATGTNMGHGWLNSTKVIQGGVRLKRVPCFWSCRHEHSVSRLLMPRPQRGWKPYCNHMEHERNKPRKQNDPRRYAHKSQTARGVS